MIQKSIVRMCKEFMIMEMRKREGKRMLIWIERTKLMLIIKIIRIYIYFP